MSCGGRFSPNGLMAAGGFLKGTGMSVSPSVQRGIDRVQGTVAGAATQAASSAAASMGVESIIKSVGSGTLPGVGGVVPSSLQGSLGTDFASGPLLAHAQKIAGSGDISGLMSNFRKASSFADLGKEALAGITEGNLPFGDIGNGIFNNMDDWVSSGIQTLGDVPDLGFDLQNLGGFANLTELPDLGNAGKFAKKLLDGGLGDVTGLAERLAAQGIPLDRLEDLGVQADIEQALAEIGDGDLIQAVQDQFGSSLKGITSLADFTKIEKVLPTSFESLDIASFQGFAGNLKKVGNFSQIANLGELGDLVSNIESVADQDSLMQLQSLIDSGAASELTSFFGGGAGEFGELGLNELVGTVAGFEVDDLQSNAASYVNQLVEEGALDNFTTRMNNVVDLEAGVFDTLAPDGSSIVYELPDGLGTYATYAEATQALADSANGTLSTIADRDPKALSLLKSGYEQVSQKVLDEQTRLTAAGIDLDEFLANDKTGLVNFAGGLNDLGSDVIEFGKSEFMEKVATENVFGEAVKGCLVEGRNRSQISMAGVSNPDFFGALEKTTFNGPTASIVIEEDLENFTYKITQGTEEQAREELGNEIATLEENIEKWQRAIQDREGEPPKTRTQIARSQKNLKAFRKVHGRLSKESGGYNRKLPLDSDIA